MIKLINTCFRGKHKTHYFDTDIKSSLCNKLSYVGKLDVKESTSDNICKKCLNRFNKLTQKIEIEEKEK